MNFSAALENGLYALGQVLRLPVMLLLWLCVFVTIFYAGRYISEAVRQRHARAGFDIKRWLQNGPVLGASSDRQAQLPQMLGALHIDVEELDARQALHDGGLENIVAEYEERLRHKLDGLRALVKIGPSLGLIGTLIPMGTSLAAMAGGDLGAMAGEMVIAFTSTIVGLATGTMAYGLLTLGQRWNAISIRELRYMAEVIAAELEAR